MTTKQYKKVCRIKVERLAKLYTCATVIVLINLMQFFGLSAYVASTVATMTWFYMPDLVAYLLECKYKLSHDRIKYRG
jgi:hypothetical protein